MNSQAKNIEQPYDTVQDYWRDRLALLSLLLHREVLMVRALRGDSRQENFLGLFISEQDIAAILNELHGHQREDFPGDQTLDERIKALGAAIEQRVAHTDRPLPLHHLAKTFDLRPHEQLLLVMTLAIEIDPRFGKVYGFLHDDVARKRVSAGLALQVLGDHSATATDMRLSLHADAPLMKFRLIQLLDDEQTPLLSRGLKLDNRVVNHLLGFDPIDDELLALMDSPWLTSTVFEGDACARSALSSAENWQQQPKPLLVETPAGSDIDVWLALFCGATKLPLLAVHWSKLASLELATANRLLRKIIREAHLTQSLALLRDVDASNQQLMDALSHLLSPLVCLSSRERLTLPNAQTPLERLRLPPLSTVNRERIWQSALEATDHTDIRALAERYLLNARTITALCTEVKACSDADLSLNQACQRQVGERMRDVAQRFDSDFRFKDIVLPPATFQALQELVARQSSAVRVFRDWGLGRVFRQSEGCAVLFIGPSGTGKTMAASVMANELGLDMYRVDLSGVVSKYIGETEKNLERIFAAAAQSQVVLFIDEADALFGKRSEVKDAHDRYANIEVSYLLQKMEEHPGLVVLASNFCQNIDDAFFRRFSAVVEFTPPRAEERLKLWQKLELTQAPLADHLDLTFLAERFDMTGGHIKNCIMAAAFQAASQHSPISMQMLIRAVSREYAKLGKPISKNSFGDYYPGLRRESAGGGS